MVGGLVKGERVALLWFLTTRDSGVLRNLNAAGGGGAVSVARAKAEITRLRGSGTNIDQVTNLDELFSGATVAAPNVVATALGLADGNFYDPGGACPPAGNGDKVIFQKLAAALP